MYIALDLRCLIVPVAIPNAVVLSTWTGVGGWELINDLNPRC